MQTPILTNSHKLEEDVITLPPVDCMTKTRRLEN